MVNDPVLPDEPGLLASLLLQDYDQRGRDLPWRNTTDPYAIWVSEVMLQQTGVITVIPYYHRFLARFPTVTCLASATPDQVLALWQGLGYYRRAVHLHQAAQQVCQQGGWPQDLAGWQALPGVGANTAAAVMAIAHHQRTAILDGNVKRVLARLIALAQPVDQPAGRQVLQRLADALTPAWRPGDYAQAIMDLGATRCLPRSPLCPACPWRDHCRGLASGHPGAFPRPVAKPIRRRLQQTTVLLQHPDGRLLFTCRPAGGLLGQLWEPLSSPTGPAAPAPETLLADHGLTGRVVMGLPLVRHAFTHFHLTVQAHVACWLAGEPGDQTRPWQWVREADCAALAMATLHRKILQTWQKARTSTMVC